MAQKKVHSTLDQQPKGNFEDNHLAPPKYSRLDPSVILPTSTTMSHRSSSRVDNMSGNSEADNIDLESGLANREASPGRATHAPEVVLVLPDIVGYFLGHLLRGLTRLTDITIHLFFDFFIRFIAELLDVIIGAIGKLVDVMFQGSICRRIAGIFLVLAVLVVIFLVNGGLSLFATAPN